MRKLLLLSFFFFVMFSPGHSQDCCDSDNKLVICYTAKEDYCGNSASCDYTFDGDYMEGIRKKLNNAANFGPAGISDCDVETKPLTNISSASDIENLECDVVFIGSFYNTTSTVTSTLLDIDFLETIKQWSIICPKNLTLLFQGETTVWGYEIMNQNENPNTSGMATTPNIFEGPFGSLNSFNQGGLFQANFTQVPSTGITVLAQDALGRPTIVLDQFTNDILLADIGIMCNPMFGEVSNSPDIMNNNDILACNILALGCQIAGTSSVSEENIFICENESHTLPDGMIVDQPGEYTTTLVGFGNCDSIIVTDLMISLPEDSLITYIGCEQDGFNVEVANTVYDQSNPMGTEILQNIYGCDSIVNIELLFNAHTSVFYDTIYCEGESVTYVGHVFSTAIDTTLIISNALNCDSVITVHIEEFTIPDISIDSLVTIENNGPHSFTNQIPVTYQTNWTPSSGLSCDNCINPILNNQENIPVYNLEIISDDGCVKNYEINVSYLCDPYIPTIFNPESISGNDHFGPLAPCLLSDYSMTIYDRWGTLIFQTEDPSVQWNGKLKNKEIIPGVYVYTCHYSNLGISDQKIGNITVLR